MGKPISLRYFAEPVPSSGQKPGKKTALIRLLLLILFVSLALSCWRPDPEGLSGTTAFPEVPEIDVWLSISDSIGVETGDSNLVLGKPVVAQRLQNGGTAVLDLMKCKVSVFDENGDFLNSFGGEGSGPGEFLMPAYLSITPSGKFVVSDAMARRLMFFDADMNYTGYMGNFFPTPPLKAVFLNDSVFVAEMTSYETTGEEMLAGFEIARWVAGTFEEEAVYFQDLKPFSLMDIGSSDIAQPVFTASRDGTVFTSTLSVDEFVVHCWSSDGNELFVIEEPFAPVPRPPEEVESEREFTHGMMRRNGMPEEMLQSIQPEEFEYAVTSLAIGPDGELWVGTGAYNRPLFRIYSAVTGSYLRTAALDSMENCGNLTIHVSPWGFTALREMSEEWPRVYLVEML